MHTLGLDSTQLDSGYNYRYLCLFTVELLKMYIRNWTVCTVLTFLTAFDYIKLDNLDNG